MSSVLKFVVTELTIRAKAWGRTGTKTYLAMGLALQGWAQGLSHDV